MGLVFAQEPSARPARPSASVTSTRGPTRQGPMARLSGSFNPLCVNGLMRAPVNLSSTYLRIANLVTYLQLASPACRDKQKATHQPIRAGREQPHETPQLGIHFVFEAFCHSKDVIELWSVSECHRVDSSVAFPECSGQVQVRVEVPHCGYCIFIPRRCRLEEYRFVVSSPLPLGGGHRGVSRSNQNVSDLRRFNASLQTHWSVALHLDEAQLLLPPGHHAGFAR